MSLRINVLLSITVAVLVPMLLLGFFTKNTTSTQLQQQYEQKVESVRNVIAKQLAEDVQKLDSTLSAISYFAKGDDKFKQYATGLDDWSGNIETFAEHNLKLSQLNLFLILDQEFVVRYSNNNEIKNNKVRYPLVSGLRNGAGLIQFENSLYFVKMDSTLVADKKFFLIGGKPIDRNYLTNLVGGSGMEASIVYSGGAISTNQYLEKILNRAGAKNLSAPEMTIDPEQFRSKLIHFTKPAKPGSQLLGANIVLSQKNDWPQLSDQLNNGLLLAFGIAALGAILVGLVLSSKVSSPLRNLTGKAKKMDIDKLDISFSESGSGETKALAIVLNDMIVRLRNSSDKILEAERRATLGDMARQINHDIRNGFIPLRTVVNHLSELSENNPEQFVEAFVARQSTLEAGLEYLEELANSYASFSNEPSLEPCKLNRIIRDTADSFPQVTINTAEEIIVMADPMSLRRIIQNLVRNAIQHLPEINGEVIIKTEAINNSAILTVSDNGCGMDEETVSHIFDHFFTTRKEGSGIGLSIVKRLVNDCSGSISVESKPGEGSIFSISIPIGEV